MATLVILVLLVLLVVAGAVLWHMDEELQRYKQDDQNRYVYIDTLLARPRRRVDILAERDQER